MSDEVQKKTTPHRWRRGTTGKHGASIQAAVMRFFIRNRGKERFHLLQLWDNWPMVMGEELAGLALPLGAKDGTLILGAEDNMLLHELSFQVPEMLDRANAFMAGPYFRQIRLELLQGRKPLYPRGKPELGRVNLPEERIRPDGLGGLCGKIDPESPAGKAYLEYVKSFEK